MGYRASRDESKILKYMPIVESIVNKMSINARQGLDRDDYISIGVIGLMDALDKYDESHNIPFEKYARWRIKGAIYDELRKNGIISRGRMDKLDTMYSAKAALQQKLLREPTDMEISRYLRIDIAELHSLYETIHYLSQSYLEETLFLNDDEYSLIELIEDKKAENPQARIEEEETKQDLVRALDTLSERERIILDMYYAKELPLKEISEILEISISRVSQIHGKSLIKLRKTIQEYNKV